MLNHRTGTGTDPAVDEIVDHLIRIFNKAAAIEREPVDIGHGVLLHPSEVHLIDIAGRYPAESVSAHADRLGVTKGAVSQTAKKLEKKGYLERIHEEGDRRSVVLRLTERGNEAFEWHRAYHSSVNGEIAGVISGFSRHDRDNLCRVLDRLERLFDRCPEERERVTERFRESTGAGR
jgi:DNA-binding MarR family transcriptional regulator